MPNHPILIVEDSSLVRRSVVRVLAAHGHQTVQAANADEADFALRNHPLHAVIADYALGGRITGLDVLRSARVHRPRAIRILISAHAPQTAYDALLGGDVQHLLAKPFAAADLLAALSG